MDDILHIVSIPFGVAQLADMEHFLLIRGRKRPLHLTCVHMCVFLSDAPVSELSLELLLLQVVLPALLEQGHTRQWLKGLVRAWTVTAGYLL